MPPLHSMGTAHTWYTCTHTGGGMSHKIKTNDNKINHDKNNCKTGPSCPMYPWWNSWVCYKKKQWLTSSVAKMWVPDTHKIRKASLGGKIRTRRPISKWWPRNMLCLKPKCFTSRERLDLSPQLHRGFCILEWKHRLQRQVKSPVIERKEQKDFPWNKGDSEPYSEEIDTAMPAYIRTTSDVNSWLHRIGSGNSHEVCQEERAHGRRRETTPDLHVCSVTWRQSHACLHIADKQANALRK